MKGRVLIIEDEPDMLFALKIGLEQDGFQVSGATNGQTGLEAIGSFEPDLVILDVSLGSNSINGFEVCQKIRTSSSVPVIFLTSRGDEIDQLLGISLGADDYLVKPFSMRLLCARVAMVLARGKDGQPGTNRIIDGDLKIDRDLRTVHVNETPIDLTRTEFNLLVALASSPHRVLTRHELVSDVWGEWFGNDGQLDVHMTRLRRKVQDAGGGRIGTSVRGVGFKLR